MFVSPSAAELRSNVAAGAPLPKYQEIPLLQNTRHNRSTAASDWHGGGWDQPQAGASRRGLDPLERTSEQEEKWSGVAHGGWRSPPAAAGAWARPCSRARGKAKAPARTCRAGALTLCASMSACVGVAITQHQQQPPPRRRPPRRQEATAAQRAALRELWSRRCRSCEETTRRRLLPVASSQLLLLPPSHLTTSPCVLLQTAPQLR